MDSHHAVGGVLDADHGLGLDVGVLNELGLILPLDDEVGLGKALLHIALADGIDGLRKDVVGVLLMDRRGTGLDGVPNGVDAGEILVLHLDGLEGLVYQGLGLGTHDGDHVAGVLDLFGQVHIGGVARAALGLGHIVRRHNGQHAGDGLGLAGIDPGHLGVGPAAAQAAAVDHINKFQVRGIVSAARHLIDAVDAGDRTVDRFIILIQLA